MRAVGLSDLDAAARALLAVPKDRWSVTAERLIQEAHIADLWRKRFGTAHPNGGTGSLYAQAALGQAVSSSQCSAQYCSALGVVLCALTRWRNRVGPKKDHET